MSDEFIEIHWTSGSLDEARHVSRFLAQERYIASAQIIPWVESIYMLDNKLDTNQESKIIFKTIASNFEKIKTVIQQNCKYAIPEIIFFKIEGSNKEYLDWLKINSEFGKKETSSVNLSSSL
jgi:periplasmic divalent cation tolerance protein